MQRSLDAISITVSIINNCYKCTTAIQVTKGRDWEKVSDHGNRYATQ